MPENPLNGDMTGVTVDWIAVKMPEPAPRWWRPWMGKAGVTSRGHVYVPVQAAGPRTLAQVAWDCIPVLVDGDGTEYVNIEWLILEAGTVEERTNFAAIRQRVLQRHREGK